MQVFFYVLSATGTDTGCNFLRMAATRKANVWIGSKTQIVAQQRRGARNGLSSLAAGATFGLGAKGHLSASFCC